MVQRISTAAAVLAVLALCLLALWRSGDRGATDEVLIAEARLGINLDSARVDVGEVSLHVVFAGPADGEPVVLLHGFPEFWFSWRYQMFELARAGFRVAAPDLRGYGRSDKPSDPNLYSGDHMAADVIGLLDALGWSRAFLAGHDVGGGIAWRLVFEHPDRFRRALMFNTGHPLVWQDAQPQDDEAAISWFRSFFRLPWLPELVGRAGGYWLLKRNLRATSRPGTFNPVDLPIYESAWANQNALSTMLNTYRAPWVAIEGIPDDGRPAIPVRIVWGEQDAFLPVKGAELSAGYIGSENVVRVPQATHWILLEEPELTSEMLLDFFAAGLEPAG